MPEAIVKKVEAQCKAGKRPKMCPPSMSCHACGEKVAAIVDAKRKKSQSAKGGRMGETDDITHLHGLYSQGDVTYEPIDDGRGIWLKVLDHDAKMIDPESGVATQVSQEALIAALPKWVSPLYPEIQANIDHNLGSIQKTFSREEFDFLEAKYEINDGLYLKVESSDPEIRGALLSKALRPSPEFKLREYEDVGDVLWPTGLGLMWEGTPVSEGSGAAAPSTIAVGGDVMTEGDPEPDPEPEREPEPNAEPEPEPEPEPEEPSAEDKLKAELEAMKKEMEELKTNYETVLKDNESQKERQDRYEKAEKAKLAKDMPDGYPVDDVSLEQMRREHLLYMHQLKEIGSKIAKGPDFEQNDKLREPGVMTDEEYAEAVRMERELMGLADGMSVGAPGTSFLQTQPQYWQEPERAPKRKPTKE